MPEAPIYQCTCGAAIRLPAERANRQLRCPQCQKGIALTAAAQPLESRVRQGHLENSNVVTVGEMVAVIETMRHFEANQKLIQGYDEMLDRAIRTLGEF